MPLKLCGPLCDVRIEDVCLWRRAFLFFNRGFRDVLRICLFLVSMLRRVGDELHLRSRIL